MRIFASILTVGAQTHPLEHVIARMDENSRTFRSLEASLQRSETNNLTKKITAVSGKLYISKSPDNLRIKVELKEPKDQAQTALVDNGVGRVYDHKPNMVSERKIGPNDPLELSLMGFGVSSERIKKTYSISLAGQETIDGKQTSVLELTSLEKDPMFPRIKMWINHQDWNAVQVQLFEATRDSIMVKYKDVKRNQSISNSIFRLDLPRDVKKAG